MTDMLQTGLDWLEVQRKAHMSRTVTYRRGVFTVALLATVGATRFDVDDGYGIVIRQRMRDYIFAVADLILNSVETLPEPGDEILDVRDAVTYRYQVAGRGAEQHYRFCDPAQTVVRVHVQEVGTEE